MAKNLYVDKLPYGTTDSDLRAMFEEFGTVELAVVIFDRSESRSAASALSTRPRHIRNTAASGRANQSNAPIT